MEEDFDVLKHDLVPKHTILTDDEKKRLLEKLQIISEQLPKILKKDPTAKALNADEGDIIKIIRNSPTAGVTTYYRFVVKK